MVFQPNQGGPNGWNRPNDHPTTSAAPEDRFTVGLLLDVAKVLEARGYGSCDGRQLVELQLHLLHLLHGDGGECMGGAAMAATVGEVE